MATKEYSLSHTKWMCKYHIIFTPKYRRKIIYNQLRTNMIDIFKRLCKYDSVNLLSVQKLNRPAVRIPSSPGFTIYTTQNEALHS